MKRLPVASTVIAKGRLSDAEVAGFGMSADAYHMTAPNVDGPKRSMKAALRNAGLNADQIQYMNAHGTSTPLGDVNETNAIKLAFGDHAKKMVVSSTKSMTGHLLGGAGALEAGITVLAVRDQIAPPTANLDRVDADNLLDLVPHQARPIEIVHAMTNSFGFGGTNASLIFKRWMSGSR